MKKKTDSNEEKENLFKNINNFLAQSGAIAMGIKAVTSNLNSKVNEMKKETQRKAIMAGLLFFGSILALYGAAQIIMFHLDLTLYTNLAVGLIFLLGALIAKAIK